MTERMQSLQAWRERAEAICAEEGVKRLRAFFQRRNTRQRKSWRGWVMRRKALA